eukprot:3388174-Amphidinium_carterae.1
MSPVFPPDVRLSGCSEFDLRTSAVWSNKLLMAKSARQEDVELNKSVFDMCEEEVRHGWLEGPFTEDEVKRRFPKGFVVSRRFGLRHREREGQAY